MTTIELAAKDRALSFPVPLALGVIAGAAGGAVCMGLGLANVVTGPLFGALYGALFGLGGDLLIGDTSHGLRAWRITGK